MVEVLKVFKKTPATQTQAQQADRPDDGPQDTAKSYTSGQSDAPATRAGWVSPRYSKSRAVQLDMALVEAHRCVGLLPEMHDSKHYKLLRTQIRQRLEERGWNSMMITSAHAGEGKTVTAINLAAMFAREFAKTVLLVDADLRQQCIHRYLGYEQSYGLVDHLYDNVPMHDIIVWPGIEKLTIISGGRTLGEGAELLNSPRMHALVEEITQRYADRYIFFDVPPLLGSADALSFAPLVDAILVVVEAGKTPMPEIQKAMSLLPREKILGTVMNRQS